jgi:cell division transport system permease protein
VLSKPLALRPARADDLGVRRALAGWLLPSLVAAMAFLAALALAGAVAAENLAQRWRGSDAVLTVQVPSPGSPADGGSRVSRAARLLRAEPGLAAVRLLGETELEALLRPWLGGDEGQIALPLPAVLEVKVPGGVDLAALAQRLDEAAPGTLLDEHGPWLRRLGALARSLEASAALATAVVAGVAAAVVAVATRAGLSARREAIAIVHDLGATDSYIAGRFAQRATLLAGAGALIGTLAALPLLAELAHLAASFGVPAGSEGNALPAGLLARLAALPLAAAMIGWLTAQGTVRRWLRRLP